MFEHHPSTVCGWLGASGTQDLRAPRLWQRSRQWRAHCRGAARLLRFATGCRLQRRSSPSTIDGVARASIAQAPKAGRAGAPWSRSPCWRLSRDAHGWRDQLGLDGESNSTLSGLMQPFSTLIFFGGSKVADGSVTRARAVRPRVTSVGDLPTSSVSATQLARLTVQ